MGPLFIIYSIRHACMMRFELCVDGGNSSTGLKRVLEKFDFCMSWWRVGFLCYNILRFWVID